MRQKQTIAILQLFFFISTSAFSAPRAVRSLRPLMHGVSSSSSLNVGAVWKDDEVDKIPNEGSIFWMARAAKCANSELCDLEEAEICLEGLSHINMANLASEKASAVSDVIANLRTKLLATNNKENEVKEITLFHVTMCVMNVVAGIYLVYALLQDCSGGSSIPLDDSVLSCFDAYTMM